MKYILLKEMKEHVIIAIQAHQNQTNKTTIGKYLQQKH